MSSERAQSVLIQEHISRIIEAYERFKDQLGFSCVATQQELRIKDSNLSIPLYMAMPSKEAIDKTAVQVNKSELNYAPILWLENLVDVRKVLEDLLALKSMEIIAKITINRWR